MKTLYSVIAEKKPTREQMAPLFKELSGLEDRYEILRSKVNEAGWISSIRYEVLSEWIAKLKALKIDSLVQDITKDAEKLAMKSKKLGI